MAHVETSNEKLTYKDAVINSIVEILKEGDGSNLKYYESYILKTIKTEFGVGNIKSLSELNSGVDKKFAGSLFQTLKNRIVSQHQRIDERTASLKKEKENLLRSEVVLHRILSINGIILEDAEAPEEVTQFEQIAEQKEFTEEPEQENIPYVEKRLPTKEEIYSAAERANNYLAKWNKSGRNEYEAMLNSSVYIDGDEYSYFSKEDMDPIVSFWDIDENKAPDDASRKQVVEMKQQIEKSKLIFIFNCSKQEYLEKYSDKA